MGLSVVTGFNRVIGELGFIVICFDPQTGLPFKKGDKVKEIWGTFEAPEPLIYIGRATRQDWERQSSILLSAGLKRIPPIAKGWRIGRVGRPPIAHVERANPDSTAKPTEAKL